jgi:hypothetical protein
MAMTPRSKASRTERPYASAPYSADANAIAARSSMRARMPIESPTL